MKKQPNLHHRHRFPADLIWTCFGKVASYFWSSRLPSVGSRADEVQRLVAPDWIIKTVDITAGGARPGR